VALGAWLLAVVLLACAVPASAEVEARDYVLGDVLVPDRSPFGPLPVRMQGAIAVPAGAGRHPLVVVVHGRHLTGCPMTDHETEGWPCPDGEQRNDLGLRHVLRALAERGMVAISPDVNGAYTEGWGEPDDIRRWPRIVNRTVDALATDVREGGTRFGIELRGRVELRRIGFLGHSRSGFNATRLARRRATEGDPLSALFLLAPSDVVPLPDVPAAVVMGTCDFDTGTHGRRYLNRARRDARRAPVVEVTLRRANHTFYNRTLSRLGQDDAAGVGGRCRRTRRLRAAVQQRWIAAAAVDFFAVTLRRARRPAWLRRHGPVPRRVHGRAVEIRRLAGSART
jgi:alpha/beta superfamily hydrolase